MGDVHILRKTSASPSNECCRCCYFVAARFQRKPHDGSSKVVLKILLKVMPQQRRRGPRLRQM
ncbi:MAG: hypothetical protein GY820_17405 [Gammaproteobacteria bacterium]|nr:hypothetical protein [Gammaproteobacteria bacterium]